VRRGSWELIDNPELGIYFYNYRTDESQWEPPPVFENDVRTHSRARGVSATVSDALCGAASSVSVDI
jgi:hypothetical protein